MHWTEADLPDLKGKCALITGANSGLGLATSLALAKAGAHVIMACRDTAKADAALRSVREATPAASLELLALNLADLASVRAAATAFRERHVKLDILCNNAGLMAVPQGRTVDGFETLFGTNHLGHFALTGLLLDTLKASPGARVVTLASIAHRSGRLPMEDLNWERGPYSQSGAYGRAKLANLSFALEFDRRLRRSGAGILSVAAHPGYSATNIVYGGSSAPPSLGRAIWNRMAAIGNVILAQPARLGALPTLYAATSLEVYGGEYIGPHGIFELRGYPIRVKASALARDETLAGELWSRSEAMTGVSFGL